MIAISTGQRHFHVDGIDDDEEAENESTAVYADAGKRVKNVPYHIFERFRRCEAALCALGPVHFQVNYVLEV